MIKKIFVIILLLIITTSCSKNNDINNLAIVNKIAIGKNNKYEITIKVLKDNLEEETYKEDGNTIDECFNKINNKLSKKIYLTHLRTLILSNNLEKDDYKNIINYFLEQDTSRNTFNVIITDFINEKILDINNDEIENLLDLSISNNGLVKKKTLDDLIKEILNYEYCYIPFIKSNEFEIKGYKKIYKEEKLLTKEESIAVNFIENNIKNVTLLIDNDNYKIENCNMKKTIKKEIISLNLECDYYGNKDSIIIEDYIKDIINNYINNNDNSYFYFIRDKYNSSKERIKIETKIKVYKIDNNKGDLLE